MFKTVKFRNFKSLKDFSIQLKTINVLVGPNNAGKSTILDAFRAIAAAQTFASRRVPSVLRVGDDAVIGYDIPTSNFPISLANIHTDYQSDNETSITFVLHNKNSLKLRFYENSRCILTTDTERPTQTTSQFKKNFPVSIYPFPTLGPLEEEEPLLTDEYVRQSQYTRRANRMFRNIWHRRIDQFSAFQELVERTWEGMTVSKPDLDMQYPPRLSMFCKEGRIDREVFWVGFGFQVWLQLLTHLLGAASANVLVVDEPEIYLHPDLQHRLFQLLKETNKQIILATHSPEIVNEAEHDDVVLVDRSKRTGRRIEDIEGLQEALFSIGSGQNIHLARLSRGKKILFLEGDDFKLMRRFSARLGLKELADDINITVIPIGGFSQRQRIEDASWTFEKVLKAEISIAAVLDRDYRCREEIDSLVCTGRDKIPNFHILDGKELENYLLVPAAIVRAIRERLKDRRSPETEITDITADKVYNMLNEIGNEMKLDILSQRIANRMRFFANKSSKDPSTIAAEAIAALEEDWKDSGRLLLALPGKQALTALNRTLNQNLRISITAPLIIRHMSPEEIGADLRNILQNLNRFASASVTLTPQQLRRRA